MDYKKHYNALINTRLLHQSERNYKRNNKNNYYEKHHIVPKSLNGSDESSNLILLTPREHFIAHWLLWKIHGGNQFWSIRMLRYYKPDLRNITSRQFDLIRTQSSILSSKNKTGPRNPFYGLEPWKNPSAKKNITIWKNLDLLYKITSAFDLKKSHIKKIFDKNLNYESSLCCIDRALLWIYDNGNPLESKDWIEFGNPYLKNIKPLYPWDIGCINIWRHAEEIYKMTLITPNRSIIKKHINNLIDKYIKSDLNRMLDWFDLNGNPTAHEDFVEWNNKNKKDNLEKLEELKLENYKINKINNMNNMNNMSRGNHWDNSKTRKNNISMVLWENAHEIYKLWINNNKPKMRNSEKLIMKELNIEVNSTVNSLINWFNENGNPNNNDKWRQWRYG